MFKAFYTETGLAIDVHPWLIPQGEYMGQWICSHPYYRNLIAPFQGEWADREHSALRLRFDAVGAEKLSLAGFVAWISTLQLSGPCDPPLALVRNRSTEA